MGWEPESNLDSEPHPKYYESTTKLTTTITNRTSIMKYTTITIITLTAILTATTMGNVHHVEAGSTLSINSKEKAKPYPLETCIVSDEDLGSMGDYISFDYKGQEIKVCCKPCIKKFNNDPKKYLKLLAKKTTKKSK